MIFYDSTKRLLDALGALLLGILLLPLCLSLAALIVVVDGRPVFFAQWRPGRGGVPFRLYKFRSMSVARDGESTKAESARVTKLGSWLRASSLDELPQLWNILRGELSFVGPRPLLMAYLPLYNDYQARRHEVRPGLSGLAQVHGRNHLSWDEKFELDVQYVDARSFRLDTSILWRSLAVAARGRTVMPQDDSWVSPFLGSSSVKK